ncbi:hypothetical protein O2N63_08420 [Aliiroseovarius sp. KMU-50]|uniref:EF-hand domain-containing protein n=1 Tax=Aliiroseovarius salicola TaxID=3009082 RepID=A0ABT4W302_9RHOB|nr:hypothetical protein [Aliiroseovarius sp. KMU-50]MDA5094113.1 hypothetical protein [Aliiroseovarius sp. KMU-50]
MKRATKIAAIALLSGTVVTLTSMGASAHGGKDGPKGMGGKMGGFGQFMQMEFADLDVDKSGLITSEDLQAKAQARFDGADANGDGELGLDEIKAHVNAIAKERMEQRHASKDGRGHGANAPRMEKKIEWIASRMLDKRDADNNGTLSMDELMPDQARFDRMIDRFDVDDDNAISAAEFDEAQKEIWMRMQHRNGEGKHGRRG